MCERLGFVPVGTHCSRTANEVIKQRLGEKDVGGGGMAEDQGESGR